MEGIVYKNCLTRACMALNGAEDMKWQVLQFNKYLVNKYCILTYVHMLQWFVVHWVMLTIIYYNNNMHIK